MSRDVEWAKHKNKSSLVLSFFRYALPAGAIATLGVNIGLLIHKQNEIVEAQHQLHLEKASYASLDIDKKTSEIELQPMP